MFQLFIMHFLTYVFIPTNSEIPEAVAGALRPFGDEFQGKPWKRRLGAEEIAAMARCYRVRKRALRTLARHMEDWNGGTGAIDENGLIAILTFNPDRKWDWYKIGGRWDGLIPGNVALAGSLLRSSRLTKLLPHDFLTPDGEWHEVETFVHVGGLNGHFVRTDEKAWLKQFKAALKTYAAYRVVCVDRHS